jgi:hypothetical protein
MKLLTPVDISWKIMHNKTSYFFGPKWHLLFRSLPFQSPKSLDFQGPPLPMALEMDLPKSLRPAQYKQQVVTYNNVLIGTSRKLNFLWFLHEEKRKFSEGCHEEVIFWRIVIVHISSRK